MYSFTCACGKMGYNSRSDAARSAKIWQGKGPDARASGNKMRAYQCARGNWHLTASQDAATRAAFKNAGMRWHNFTDLSLVGGRVHDSSPGRPANLPGLSFVQNGVH